VTDIVTCTITDGVADVRLNRPEKLNAVNPAMFGALGDMGDRLKKDTSVRAVVLSGEGRGFCSGLDFSAFQAMAGQSDESFPPRADGAGDGGGTRIASGGVGDEGIVNGGQYAAWVWYELPAPVIAAIRGPALGAGFQIALACDFRFVAPDAKLSALEMRWGLVPDMTGTQMLPRLVGLDVARELVYTGRMVSGEEAVQLGLATRVAEDPFEEAMAFARELAGKSPHAIRGAKRLLSMAGVAPLAEGFQAEARTMGSLIGSPNNVEAVTAFFEKRDPKFEDVTE
jgi:enoyl-CoA hydratase/carnithine racemase